MKNATFKAILPDHEFRTNPLKRPECFNFAYDIVDKRAREDRNRLAMIWVNQQGDERRLTYYDFSRLSNQAANLLCKNGVRKGDRVLLMLPRVPEWWVFSLALIKLGAVQCSTPTLCTPEELRQRINFAKFKVVISDMENAPKFDEIYDDCPLLNLRILIDGDLPDWINYQEEIKSRTLSATMVKTTFPVKTKSTDPLLLTFTSGTSKYPKLVMHTCDYPLAHRITAEMWHGLNSNDLHYAISDAGWAKNLWGNYFGQWIVGCCVFIYDIRGKFNPDEILPIIEKYSITSFCAPPTIYRMLVISDLKRFDLRELKKSVTAGEPLQTDTIKLWQEGTGLPLREGYGQTETVCMIANFSDVDTRPGSIGKAAPGWEIELHDDDGNIVPQGEAGRIAVSLKNGHPIGLLQHYIQNDEENAKCFIGDYYYTGDKAYQDEDGYFYFVGRSDDIIKSSGYRIGPVEVEEVLMNHPAICECAVVGAPDPIRGAKVKAYVKLNEGYEPTESMVREIQHFSKQHSAPYKYPREIEFVTTFPKTISGKIKRDILRRHAETGEITW